MCTNHCIATVVVLTIASLPSNEQRAFQGFYGLNSYCMGETCPNINEWFKATLSTLNFDKMHFMQFSTKNGKMMDMSITHNNSQIASISDTKFLGLMIHSTLSWKGHTEWLMSRLSSAIYAIRAIKTYTSLESMRSVYFSYFHSIMTYGMIVWGNSPFSIRIFKLQKRVIRIITKSRSTDSCREFMKLKILPLCSQYIFSLLLFVAKNKDLFLFNSEIHVTNTRHSNNLHYPSCNLRTFQRGTY
jgi:hypothetical protein